MDDKLIRFFNKINFDEVDDFEGVKVSKVVINKQKESWIVYLQSDKVVNPEAMIKLINKAKNGIENVNTIDIKTDYSNDSYSSQGIVNEEYLMQPYKMERKFVKEGNVIKIILKKSVRSSEVEDEVELFEYELQDTNYAENNHIYYAQRKDMGVDKINSEEDFDIYVIGGNVTIAKNNEEAKDFSEAIEAKYISIDEILKQAEVDSKYGVCRRGFYSDGGTIEYRYQDYTLIKANTLAGNKDFIIAPPNMIWSEISSIVYK